MHFLSFYSVCVGCPKDWECCGRAWGKCVCRQPKWNSCCKQIPDPACVNANTACVALWNIIDNGVKYLKKKLKQAKAVLSKAQGAVNFAERVLKNAVKALDVVKTTYKVGIRSLKAIDGFTLTKIINIKEMYFEVKLSAATGGKFQCRVKGVLMGRNINLKLRFDIRNILSIAKSLGEEAVPGISKFVCSYKSCRSGMAHNYFCWNYYLILLRFLSFTQFVLDVDLSKVGCAVVGHGVNVSAGGQNGRVVVNESLCEKAVFGISKYL